MGRFENVSEESVYKKNGCSFLEVIILKDTYTGALYLYTGGATGGGLTPLLGPDGRPQFDRSYD